MACWMLRPSALCLLILCRALPIWGASLARPANIQPGSGGASQARECPIPYRRMTAEEVAEGAQQPGGLKPYLFGGGHHTPKTVPPGRREWWGDLCYFKYSLYYVAPDGNRWAAVAVCNEDAQRRLLRSWAGRGYELPLTLTPCDLWSLLAGRTLFLLGDSITQDLSISLLCFLFEFREGPVLVEEAAPFPLTHPLTTDPVALEELPDYMRPSCALLLGAARICFFRTDRGENFHGAVLPWLLRHQLTRKDDLLVANFGLHHGDRQEYSRLVRELAGFVQQHRAELPTMFWQQTTAQHYSTPDGEGQWGQPPFKCSPLRGFSLRGLGELVLEPGTPDPGRILRGGWRNVVADPVMRAAGIPIVGSFNETVAMWEDHRDNHDGQDCTHYCFPSAVQSAVVSLYRALRKAQPPATSQL